jgi:hypothetical protein
MTRGLSELLMKRATRTLSISLRLFHHTSAWELMMQETSPPTIKVPKTIRQILS